MHPLGPSMVMKALVWDGEHLRLIERPKPEAGKAKAVVRVRLAGVCSTDLEITRGYMSFRGVLGHEMVGTVAEGPAEWRGARVVAEINFACGRCERCRTGLGRHCAARRVMGIDGADGAFAEYVLVPTTNLHRVPEHVADAVAVFTEPLAAAFEVLEQLTVEPGTRCLVLGDGKLGTLLALVLHQAGLDVLAVGKHPAKLRLLEASGIETALAQDSVGASAPLVIEATGRPDGLCKAISLTEPRGRLVLKSTLAVPAMIDVAAIVVNEIQVIGSRCGPFGPALRALGEHRVDPMPLISARLPLSRAEEAMARAREPDALKVLIEP